MKILCVYHDDPEPDYFTQVPEVQLCEHWVTFANTYSEGMQHLNASLAQGKAPFDVILSDMFVPCSPSIATGLVPAGPLFALKMDQCRIRGLGIFVPTPLYSLMYNIEGRHSIVSAHNCWNATGRRNWRSLLSLLVACSQIKKLQ